MGIIVVICSFIIFLGYILWRHKVYTIWTIFFVGMLYPVVSSMAFGESDTQSLTIVFSYGLGSFFAHKETFSKIKKSIFSPKRSPQSHNTTSAYYTQEEFEQKRRQYEERDRRRAQHKVWENRPTRETGFFSSFKRRAAAFEEMRHEYVKSQHTDEEAKKSGKKSHNSSQNRANLRDKILRKSEKYDYLNVLGLDGDNYYNAKEIKKAYRKMAKKYHPDKFHNADDKIKQEMTDRFTQIGEAHKWLVSTVDSI